MRTASPHTTTTSSTAVASVSCAPKSGHRIVEPAFSAPTAPLFDLAPSGYAVVEADRIGRDNQWLNQRSGSRP